MTGIKSHELVERALELSRADGCLALVDEDTTANLRWADNALTTNGVTHGRRLTVVATVDGAEGTASGVVAREAVTPADVEELVRAAEAAARAAGPAEDARPLLVGDRVSADFTEGPAATSIDVFRSFAPALGSAFARARAAGQALYGFARHEMSSTYLGTSGGLRLRHDQPTGSLELNAKAGRSSAWAGAATRDFRDIHLDALHTELDERLGWGKRRIDLPAGRYETLVPPSALADLMITMHWSMGARDAVEGRTVFSRPNGASKIGERLARLPLTLRSDPAEPGLESAPFLLTHSSDPDTSVFDNGLPLGPTDWIRDGELANLMTSRHTAALTGLPVRPAGDNLVLSTADQAAAPTLAEMVANTGRGLLLTCLWYIREVDPATLLLTGLTRDGVYLVEDGQVVGEVNNFRFNESPVDLLGRITEAGRTERCLPREWSDWFSRAAMPAVRVPDFNMSSVSKAS
ncbi:metallopeptidase TldD-related protein [Kitasatospora mediocidica]|uniref:metallopeptidase TldD-related protein n=1 Tax=Kitasatospora mediocidica TaxID=58352 RepID=UPI00055D996C|nr:metallopeptidase TldD-related protein [Kitasatospora mediocidica]